MNRDTGTDITAPSAGARRSRRWLRRAALAAGAAAALVLVAVIVLRSVFHLTSSNSMLYLLRYPDGRFEITSHVRQNQYPLVERFVDLSRLFAIVTKTEAKIGRDIIELTWNEKEGDGIIKEFRADGTEFLVVLARHLEDAGTPQGAFIGGDLPLGDIGRSTDAGDNNTGIAFYNGRRWFHIWCALNEGVWLSVGDGRAYNPGSWTYLGSRVVKESPGEVIVESNHEIKVPVGGTGTVRLLMTRTVQKKSGEDYIILTVEFRNEGVIPFSYSYELGDEPWVGNFFRGSKGNIGWTDGAVYKYEGAVRTSEHRFAGFWDIGNDVIGESGNHTGYADFIEWLSEPPDQVYFANQFGFDRIDGKRPLASWNNRVIALDWLNQVLRPGERRRHRVALGMARPPVRAFLPEKPEVRRPAF